jgi:hypothetical protein
MYRTVVLTRMLDREVVTDGPGEWEVTLTVCNWRCVVKEDLFIILGEVRAKVVGRCRCHEKQGAPLRKRITFFCSL